jgi:hypothetical protein
MEVEIKAAFQGREPKLIKKFSILLTVMNARKGQRIADADSAFLLIKDSRFEIPFEYPQTESNFLVVEIPVDRPVRKVLYEADKGELKVGTILIQLSNAQLEGIRSVIDGLPPLASEMKNRNKDVTASVQSSLQRAIKKVASPLEVESDRFGFIDTPVQVTFLIGLSDNYWDEYREARTTHFAFQVWNLNGKLSGYFYMVRGEKAEQLRKTILATGITAPKATVTFVIKREKFKSNSPFFTAELLDWIQ